MNDYVFAGLFLFCCLGYAVNKALKKLGDSPEVKDKAKEIGFGLLAKWLGGK